MPPTSEELRTVHGSADAWPRLKPRYGGEEEVFTRDWTLGRVTYSKQGRKNDTCRMKRSTTVIVVKLSGLDEGAVENSRGQGTVALCLVSSDALGESQGDYTSVCPMTEHFPGDS